MLWPLRGAFVEAASRRLCRGRFAAPWYNNLKAAACAAVRTLCADALPHMGFENIEPCKTAAGAVLLGPQHGATV